MRCELAEFDFVIVPPGVSRNCRAARPLPRRAMSTAGDVRSRD
jgi:hypothetical protein